MLQRFRNQVGSAGLIVAIVALVAALGGGAYAATSGGGGKASASAKQGKQGKQGKPGKTGKTGPQGPAGTNGTDGKEGPQGKEGKAGTNGTNGTNGTPGTAGTNGKNIEVGSPTVGECANGGATVQVTGEAATKKAVCNGNPAEYPETLPSGRTETGVWSLPGYVLAAGFEELNAPISFPIKLSAQPTPKYVSPAQSGTPGSVTGCPGTVTEPQAEAGDLCIYALGGGYTFSGAVQGPPFGGIDGKSGAVLGFQFEAGETEALGYGTWAVMAP